MARVSRFAGVRPTSDGMWEAYVRPHRSGQWQLVGIFDCERLALAAYKRHRRVLAEPRETRAHVERLLALAAAFPVEIEAFSLHRSTMDFALLDRGA